MDSPRSPEPSPSIPQEKVDECVRALSAVRDDLLKVSFLLRDHLEEMDLPARALANEVTTGLIQQCRNR